MGMYIPKKSALNLNDALEEAMLEKHNQEMRSLAQQIVKVKTGESQTLETESAEEKREKKEVEKGKAKGRKFFGLFDTDIYDEPKSGEPMTYTEEEMKALLQKTFQKGYEECLKDMKIEMDRDITQLDQYDRETPPIVETSLLDADDSFRSLL